MGRAVRDSGGRFAATRWLSDRRAVALSVALLFLSVVVVLRTEPVAFGVTASTAGTVGAGLVNSSVGRAGTHATQVMPMFLPRPVDGGPRVFGVVASGVGPLVEQPVNTSTRTPATASAAVGRSPAGLVTVSDNTVTAGKNDVKAAVGRVTLAGRQLGSVTTSCRDGRVTATRTGTTILACAHAVNAPS